MLSLAGTAWEPRPEPGRHDLALRVCLRLGHRLRQVVRRRVDLTLDSGYKLHQQPAGCVLIDLLQASIHRQQVANAHASENVADGQGFRRALTDTALADLELNKRSGNDEIPAPVAAWAMP